MSAVDVYMGRPPATIVACALRRGRAIVTLHPGPALAAGLDEVLVCESSPQHTPADWAALTDRGRSS